MKKTAAIALGIVIAATLSSCASYNMNDATNTADSVIQLTTGGFLTPATFGYVDREKHVIEFDSCSISLFSYTCKDDDGNRSFQWSEDENGDIASGKFTKDGVTKNIPCRRNGEDPYSGLVICIPGTE